MFWVGFNFWRMDSPRHAIRHAKRTSWDGVPIIGPMGRGTDDGLMSWPAEGCPDTGRRMFDRRYALGREIGSFFTPF